jgi:hypothetical protein
MPFTQKATIAVIDEMCRRYLARENMTEIASRIGCDRTTVHYWLRKRGVAIRSISDAKRRYQLREDAFAVIADEATA